MDFSQTSLVELGSRVREYRATIHTVRVTAYSPLADQDPAAALGLIRDVLDRYDRARAAEFEKASR